MSVKSYIKGVFLNQIYHNQENGFSIGSLLVTEHTEDEERVKLAGKVADVAILSHLELPTKKTFLKVTISGYFPELMVDQTYCVYGQFVKHPKYGDQYEVKSFEGVAVSGKSAVVAYLCSDIFEGIGQKTAQNIVEVLGDDALATILEDRLALEKVPKLSKKQADKLYETLVSQQGLEQVMAPLYGLNLSPKMIMKIFKRYQYGAMALIRENPYRLMTDIEGIGFTRADQIAIEIGFELNDPRRIRAALMYVIDQIAMQRGHTYVYFEQLIQSAMQYLNKGSNVLLLVDEIKTQVSELIKLREIYFEGDFLFIPKLVEGEKGIVAAIQRLQAESTQSLESVTDTVLALKAKQAIDYAPEQEQAIIRALVHPVSIITGGPGTGKTTVVQGILKAYAMYHQMSLDPQDYTKEGNSFPLALAAPTGRAAKRLSETTNLKASTIHRLLGYGIDGEFTHNEFDQLTHQLIIIDETSMLDTLLAYQLFQSIKNGAHVVLVGDDNQLPSVGPGQVLKDLIECQVVPVTRLVKIHRQAQDSSIISLAYAIKNNRVPSDIFEKKCDRLFVPCPPTELVDKLTWVVKNALSKGYSNSDLQVLVPMYKGVAGIDALNVVLQQVMNPPGDDKRELVFGQKTYRIGDKVLQLVNQPETGIMNGDVGEIIGISHKNETKDKEEKVIVEFEGKEVAYKKSELTQLTHAYCVSVHKSQGSEYPIVIMPITFSYYVMLQKKLYYTGITRAKKSIILLGEVAALEKAAQNEGDERQTTLKLRFELATQPQVIENPYADYFKQHDIPFETYGELELENVTPYDFLD